MASLVSDITLSFGATSVIISTVKVDSIHPERRRNFTMHTLNDNSRVIDVAGAPKRRWQLNNEVPLTSTQKTDLEALYAIADSITLTESFIDTGATYSVFFEDFRKRRDTPQGDDKYNIVLQEV